ncbi:MAG: hypothetical protein KU29_12715 [Sulfurovum sp. FS06-10]|nr:MAG: hypothetical protein KU29_12715 [Sulfurovum sp. FS06-10]
MTVLPKGCVKALLSLRTQKQISGSQFRTYSTYLDGMLNGGGIRRKQITKQRFEIILVDRESFDRYLKSQFNIVDLEGYLVELQNPSSTRAKMLSVSRNDKAKKINPLDGAYLSCYESIEIIIDNEMAQLAPLNGSCFFVSKSCQLEISEEILIVGVENVENLLFIQQQSHYFAAIPQKKLFIFRNKFMLEWLEKIDNDYLHYGDFDFAGISIYKSQILPRLKGEGSFFIPAN